VALIHVDRAAYTRVLQMLDAADASAPDDASAAGRLSAVQRVRANVLFYLRTSSEDDYPGSLVAPFVRVAGTAVPSLYVSASLLSGELYVGVVRAYSASGVFAEVWSDGFLVDVAEPLLDTTVPLSPQNLHSDAQGQVYYHSRADVAALFYAMTDPSFFNNPCDADSTNPFNLTERACVTQQQMAAAAVASGDDIDVSSSIQPSASNTLPLSPIVRFEYLIQRVLQRTSSANATNSTGSTASLPSTPSGGLVARNVSVQEGNSTVVYTVWDVPLNNATVNATVTAPVSPAFILANRLRLSPSADPWDVSGAAPLSWSQRMSTLAADAAELIGAFNVTNDLMAVPLSELYPDVKGHYGACCNSFAAHSPAALRTGTFDRVQVQLPANDDDRSCLCGSAQVRVSRVQLSGAVLLLSSSASGAWVSTLSGDKLVELAVPAAAATASGECPSPVLTGANAEFVWVSRGASLLRWPLADVLTGVRSSVPLSAAAAVTLSSTAENCVIQEATLAGAAAWWREACGADRTPALRAAQYNADIGSWEDGSALLPDAETVYAHAILGSVFSSSPRLATVSLAARTGTAVTLQLDLFGVGNDSNVLTASGSVQLSLGDSEFDLSGADHPLLRVSISSTERGDVLAVGVAGSAEGRGALWLVDVSGTAPRVIAVLSPGASTGVATGLGASVSVLDEVQFVSSARSSDRFTRTLTVAAAEQDGLATRVWQCAFPTAEGQLGATADFAASALQSTHCSLLAAVQPAVSNAERAPVCNSGSSAAVGDTSTAQVLLLPGALFSSLQYSLPSVGGGSSAPVLQSSLFTSVWCDTSSFRSVDGIGALSNPGYLSELQPLGDAGAGTVMCRACPPGHVSSGGFWAESCERCGRGSSSSSECLWSEASQYSADRLNTSALLHGEEYQISIVGVSANGLASVQTSKRFRLDLTPPQFGFVVDTSVQVENATQTAGSRLGPDGSPLPPSAVEQISAREAQTLESVLVTPNDVDFQIEMRAVAVRWAPILDPESGVANVSVCLGSAPGRADLVACVPLSDVSATRFVFNGLNLTHGQKVYSTVVARSFAGLSANKSTNGVAVDLTPPVMSYVKNGFVQNQNVDSTSAMDFLFGNWRAIDDVSTIAEYQFRAGTTPNGDQVRGWRTATSRTVFGMYYFEPELEAGKQYYLSVRAINAAGLVSAPMAGPAIIVGPNQQSIPADKPSSFMFQPMSIAEATSGANKTKTGLLPGQTVFCSVAVPAGAFAPADSNSSLSMTGESLNFSDDAPAVSPTGIVNPKKLPAPLPQMNFGGLSFTLDLTGPDGQKVTEGTAFQKGINISMVYDVEGLLSSRELTEEELNRQVPQMQYWDTETSSWKLAADSCNPAMEYNDRVARVYTVTICHFTQFGLFFFQAPVVPNITVARSASRMVTLQNKFAFVPGAVGSDGIARKEWDVSTEPAPYALSDNTPTQVSLRATPGIGADQLHMGNLSYGRHVFQFTAVGQSGSALDRTVYHTEEIELLPRLTLSEDLLIDHEEATAPVSVSVDGGLAELAQYPESELRWRIVAFLPPPMFNHTLANWTLPDALLSNVSAVLDKPLAAQLPANLTAQFARDTAPATSLQRVNALGTYLLAPVLFHVPSGGVIRVQFTDGREALRVVVAVLPRQAALLDDGGAPALFAALYLLATLVIGVSFVVPKLSARFAPSGWPLLCVRLLCLLFCAAQFVCEVLLVSSAVTWLEADASVAQHFSTMLVLQAIPFTLLMLTVSMLCVAFALTLIGGSASGEQEQSTALRHTVHSFTLGSAAVAATVFTLQVFGAALQEAPSNSSSQLRTPVTGAIAAGGASIALVLLSAGALLAAWLNRKLSHRVQSKEVASGSSSAVAQPLPSSTAVPVLPLAGALSAALLAAVVLLLTSEVQGRERAVASSEAQGWHAVFVLLELCAALTSLLAVGQWSIAARQQASTAKSAAGSVAGGAMPSFHWEDDGQEEEAAAASPATQSPIAAAGSSVQMTALPSTSNDAAAASPRMQALQPLALGSSSSPRADADGASSPSPVAAMSPSVASAARVPLPPLSWSPSPPPVTDAAAAALSPVSPSVLLDMRDTNDADPSAGAVSPVSPVHAATSAHAAGSSGIRVDDVHYKIQTRRE